MDACCSSAMRIPAFVDDGVLRFLQHSSRIGSARTASGIPTTGAWIVAAIGLFTSLAAATAYGRTEVASADEAARSKVDASKGAGHEHPQRCAKRPDRDLFFDDFDGPNLNPIWRGPLPDAPYRFRSVDAAYLGDSNFSFQSLDGSSVVRLQNILANTQRRGWSSSETFSTDSSIVYEARFNTLVQSPTTGIDELLEIWLLDANEPENYDIVALLTPGYGAGRDFTASSSITGAGVDTPFFFAQNTWYRMVIRGSQTQQVRASIYNDAGTEELIGVDLGHDLSAYASGFRIGVSQSMGFPGSPYPTDVAIDSVRLTAAPSSTVIIRDCDSGTPNPVFASGCATTDLVAECAERSRRHGPFLKCVSRLTSDLKDAGVITRRQKANILRCASTVDAPMQ